MMIMMMIIIDNMHYSIYTFCICTAVVINGSIIMY